MWKFNDVKSLFTGKNIQALVSKGVQTARQAGVNLPIDKELAGLQEQKRELNSKKLTLASMLTSVLPGVQKADPSTYSILMGQLLKSTDLINAAMQRLEKTLAQGTSAQKALLALRPDAKATTQFYALLKGTQEKNTEALLEAQRAITAIQKASAVAPRLGAKGVVKGAAQAAYQTGAEAFQRAGQAAQDVGAGALEVAPYLKYLPHVAIGVGAIWVLSMVTRMIPQRKAQ